MFAVLTAGQARWVLLSVLDIAALLGTIAPLFDYLLFGVTDETANRADRYWCRHAAVPPSMGKPAKIHLWRLPQVGADAAADRCPGGEGVLLTSNLDVLSA